MNSCQILPHGNITSCTCLPTALAKSLTVSVLPVPAGPSGAPPDGGGAQTGGVAKVLKAVCKLGVDRVCNEVVIFSVAAQLAQPLEVILTGHLCDEGRCVCVCVCVYGGSR